MARSQIEPDRPDDDAIEAAFDDAIERRTAAEKRGVNDRYAAGVAAALGWVLGQYDDKPFD